VYSDGGSPTCLRQHGTVTEERVCMEVVLVKFQHLEATLFNVDTLLQMLALCIVNLVFPPSPLSPPRIAFIILYFYV
jgi:hypothetical protein